MDKRITWTENALREKVAILKYWKVRNKSNQYSEKLNRLFKNTLKTLQKHPSLGKETEDPSVRFILAKVYFIYYIETNESFVVVHILDGRRNPDERKYQRKK